MVSVIVEVDVPGCCLQCAEFKIVCEVASSFHLIQSQTNGFEGIQSDEVLPNE